jgi:hypothetical protein
MFHTYVQALAKEPDGQSRKAVDMGRAQFLMDTDLIHDAVAWAEKKWPELEAQGALSQEQVIWDRYCEKHEEKYGDPFRPNVDPHWN